MPTAWEESYGHGVGAGIQTVSGGAGGAGIEYTPNMLPDGMALHLAWSPDPDNSNINDKAVGGDNGASLSKSSFGGALELGSALTGVEGLTVFTGYEEIEKFSGNDVNGDGKEFVVGAKYAIGSITLGYQYSKEDLDTTTVSHYDNNAFGVSFNVNDNLTLSYGRHDSEKKYNDTTADVELTATSVQAAYTMGGMSIRIADGGVDNSNYSTAVADDNDGRTISVSLAF